MTGRRIAVRKRDTIKKPQSAVAQRYLRGARALIALGITAFMANAVVVRGAIAAPEPTATHAGPSVAQTSAASGAPSAADKGSVAKPGERDAAALLAGINPAAQRLNYEGTFVFQRGDSVQSSRIVHFVDGAADSYEKIESLDGKPRSVVQHNDALFTYLPDTHTVILDRRKTQDNFPALLSAGSASVQAVYNTTIEGSDRVADVDCQVVVLHPIDRYRFAYRLYVDRASGLLMRAQTLDPEGRVLEQVAFSQIRLGAPSNEVRRAIRASVNKLGDWRQVRAPAEPVDIEASGWSLDTGVPGFRKILELRRPMAARDPGLPPVPVDQAVFSDGVAAVSLFIEPVDKSDRKPGEGRSGATHMLAEQHGAFWLTLIGEVPADTLRKFAASIQFKSGK